MRLGMAGRACVLMTLAAACQANAAFLSTTLDGASFTSRRVTDPAGTTTYVGDELSGLAVGNGQPVPIGQAVTVGVALPDGKSLRVAPNVQYVVELVLGAQSVAGASFANVSAFSGSVVVDVNGTPTTRTIPFFEEAIVNGSTSAFRFTSQYFPASAASPALIRGFEFTFNVGSVGLLNRPALTADDLRLTVRGSTFVPNAQVATLPSLVTVTPEPGTALSASLMIALAGRRVGKRSRGDDRA